jgi:hypothetical protein
MEIRGLDRLGRRLLQTADLPVFKRVVSSFRTLTHQ